MIGLGDNATIEIYNRLKHIVDNIYRKKGMSSQDIRTYFLKRKNFKKLVHCMGDLRYIYESDDKRPLTFEGAVSDILFYRVLLDRIYAERDNPQEEEPEIEDYRKFLKKEIDKKPPLF